MEISQLLINFFSGIFLALFAIGLSFNFRVVKFLDLSYGSFFTVGAYVAYYFFPTPFIGLLMLIILSLSLGSLLYLVTKKIGNDILTSTIASLGVGLLVEEILRIMHPTGYFLVLEATIKSFNLLGVEVTEIDLIYSIMLLTILAMLILVYKSKYGIRIKFIEEDVELAEMYGVNCNLYEILFIFSSSFLSLSIGFLSSPHQAIFPSMGWSVLISGIIALAITSQFKLVGLRYYLMLTLVCIAYSELIGWWQ